ncbi:MAG: NADH-quinone oxidoreductase subunit NuoF [Caldisericia bacterium]
MRIARSHVLVGIDPESILKGVYGFIDNLKREIKERGLEDEIKVLETGSFGLTGKGIVMVVYPEGIYYVNLKIEDIKRIVEEHFIKGRPVNEFTLKEGVEITFKEKEETGASRKQTRVVLENSGIINPENIDEYIGKDGYKALEKSLFEMKPEDVVEEIKKSNLRGRGGAGFPTGLKLEGAKKTVDDIKYIICNADEGEPGTFKDRLILEGDPHKLIEGMIIMGYSIGSNKGFIYIRGEYALSINRITKAINDAREYGLLGQNILGSGFSFDIEVKKGAGAYVCGEETALIESIEGKRGEPRIKPPYPVTFGLFGKPTVVNNVETISNIPKIILNGADWFKSLGTPTCPGTKVYTILGHVNLPGLIEVPMGTTLKEIIYLYGNGIKNGKKFKAALVGGAAGVFLSEKFLDVKMDFDNLKEYKAVLGSGAILVMDEDTSIVNMLHSIIRFFNHESCGQCAPCRIGTKELLDIVEKILNHKGKKEDLDKMISISNTMFLTSLCPLGQSLILPIKSGIENFREEFLHYIRD